MVRPPGYVLLALLLAGAAEAESIRIDTDAASGIQIQVLTPFAARSGAQPLRIEVQNLTRRDRSWRFEFISYGSSGGMTRRMSSNVEVASGEARGFELVVPFAGDIEEMGSIQMRVAGFGLSNPDWQYPLATYYSPEVEPWFAISSSIHAEAQRGIPFEPDLLPSDWRGLIGLRSIVLTEEEWRKTSPGARAALTDWVARGGRLVRLGAESIETAPPGLGAVVSAPRPATPEDWSRVLETKSPNQSIPYNAWTNQYFSSIETRSGLLLLFLVTYAVLVGPVNLFVFCSRGRRVRLFWTMPAIALGASVLLGISIALQDGLGGKGVRVLFVRLVPEISREVLVQEQVSRTGALLTTGFELSEPAALFYAPRGYPLNSGELSSTASRFSGNWFRSRWIQTHRIEAVRAGRARIEWSSESSIVSAIEGPLEEIHFRDEDGRCWKALDVAPGRAIALESENEAEYERFWRALAQRAGPSGRVHLERAYWERGAFLAKARPSGVFLETLDGIDWEDTVIYSGRIVGDRGNP